MIVINEDSMIHGNTVLQPEYSPSVNTENKRDEKVKRKNIKGKKLKQKRMHSKINVIRNIGLTFIVGLTLVSRYSAIYNMQMELNNIKTNINEINKDNENLKVDLVKYNNLQYIEDIAINRLHMIQPDKSSAIYTDIDKDSLKYTEKKNGEDKQPNIWDRFKKVLF